MIDDKEFIDLDRAVASACYWCKRLKRENPDEQKCEAFGDKKIPDAIWKGKNPHRIPFPGDHGLRFAPLEKTKKS